MIFFMIENFFVYLHIKIIAIMKRLFTLITLVLLGLFAFSQNTSPLVVKDFVLKSNEIIDMEQIPKFNRTDLDNNPICRIKVKAQGFEEGILQKFVFVPKGIEITHSVFKDGMWYLHVSSNKNGEITVKYMGDCVFRLPYQLEPKKVYELTLAMETGTLVIRTIPTHAEIFIDNEMVGKGEAIKAVSIGAEHRYRVVCEDYYTKEGVIYFAQREEKSINVELESNFGFITIKSDPSGADVYVDNVKVGTTPYMMKKITIGNHVVELRKMGYENYADMVDITRDDVNKQMEEVVLAAERIVMGTMAVYSNPEDADITVDGDYMGRTPQTFDIKAGQHEVVLSKPGCIPATKTVFVAEGITTNVNIYLPVGRDIFISTDKDGDKIYVDGEYVGLSPLTTLLSYGGHEVKAERGPKTISQNINVSQTGGTDKVELSFELRDKTFRVNGLSFDMVAVKGGTFTMGCTGEQGSDCYDGEKPSHKVTLSDFYIGKYEVTVAQFEEFVNETGYRTDAEKQGWAYMIKKVDGKAQLYEAKGVNWRCDGKGNIRKSNENNHPVMFVSWNDAKAFCDWMKNKTGQSFRLPTEAEWEYAARGGRKSRGFKYAGSNNRNDVDHNVSYNNEKTNTEPVGSKTPNELGIYNMTGNVEEYCLDFWGDYSSEAQTNPIGPKYGQKVITRGGSYLFVDNDLRISRRTTQFTNVSRLSYGFRLAINPSDTLDLMTNQALHVRGTIDMLFNAPGVNVKVIDDDMGAKDDFSRIIYTSAGTKTLTFSKYGFEDVKQEITMEPAGTVKLVVVMPRARKSPEGAYSTSAVSKGVFSVSETDKVRLATGNLQYQASTKTYRIAEQPWEMIGKKNKKISSSYNGWIDLFGWGTGDEPTKPSYGDFSKYVEWGENNISNGGGNMWFTLSKDEWNYVLFQRYTTSVRFAKAKVNGVCGLIILPDGWQATTYKLKDTDNIHGMYSKNKISLDVWNSVFASAGAVFLPACGYRIYGSVDNVGSYGTYYAAFNPYYLVFDNGGFVKLKYAQYPTSGYGVRLACPAE